MGYLSTFEIRVKPVRDPSPNVVRYYQVAPLLEQVQAALKDVADLEMSHWPPRDYLAIGDVKWYSADDDFRAVSRRFPSAVLKVTRYGEDDGDIERRFYHNGRVGGGKAEIVFPPNPFEVTDGK